jgi:hypothetical protein
VPANLAGVPRVALPPIALLVLAGIGDAAGLHQLSFFLLVCAVPAAAIAALVVLDASFTSGGAVRRLAYAWLNGLALVFLLVATAARAPARGDVPRVAVSAFVACLLVLAAEALVAGGPTLRALGRALIARPARTAEESR